MRGTFSMHEICPHCGAELKRMPIDLFGKTRDVFCYGSCGCSESQWDGVYVPDGMRLYAEAGIPRRYLSAEADLGDMPQRVASGMSLYIHGTFGSGKTRYACALLKAIVDMGVSARFENSKHLISEIQGTYSGKWSNALDRAYGCKVLVLDDIGKEQCTEYSISMLYELIDARYSDAKPIVTTSNFSRGELLSRLAAKDAATAESIVSRLCENAETLYFGGADRRLA